MNMFRARSLVLLPFLLAASANAQVVRLGVGTEAFLSDPHVLSSNPYIEASALLPVSSLAAVTVSAGRHSRSVDMLPHGYTLYERASVSQDLFTIGLALRPRVSSHVRLAFPFGAFISLQDRHTEYQTYGNPPTSFDSSSTDLGPFIGAGAEVMLSGRVSASLDGRYHFYLGTQPESSSSAVAFISVGYHFR